MEEMDMFDVSNPDCSNGSAESGWTVYLEHSFPPPDGSSLNRRTDFLNPNYNSFGVQKVNGSREDDQEELDLSMVSDASSGPQTFRENEVGFQENDHGCFYPSSKTARLAKTNMKKKESKGQGCHEDQEQSSYLDDTASSPNFNFNTERSTCGQNQFNSLQQSSLSGNQKQKNQWFKGKRFGLR